MSDLQVESSFHKHSVKIDNYLKITEWIDSSIGQSTVIQEFNCDSRIGEDLNLNSLTK